jgi:hypothetical protein
MSRRIQGEISLLQKSIDLTGFTDIVQLTSLEERRQYLSCSEELDNFHVLIKGRWILYDEEDAKERVELFRSFYIALCCKENRNTKDGPTAAATAASTAASQEGTTISLPTSLWRYIRSFLLIQDKLSPDMLIMLPNNYPFIPPVIRFLNGYDHVAIALNSVPSTSNTRDLSIIVCQVPFHTAHVTIAECLVIGKAVFLYGRSTNKFYSLCSVCSVVGREMAETIGSNRSGLITFQVIGQRFPLKSNQQCLRYCIPQCNIYTLHEVCLLQYAKLFIRRDENTSHLKVVKVQSSVQKDASSIVPVCAYDCSGDADEEMKEHSAKRSCQDNWIAYIADLQQLESIVLPCVNKALLERSSGVTLSVSGETQQQVWTLNSVEELIKYMIDYNMTDKSIEEIVGLILVSPIY